MTTKTKNDKRYKLIKTIFAVAKNQNGIPPAQLREAVPEWGFPRLSKCNNADLRAILSQLKRWYVASGRAGTASQQQLDYMQRLWELKSRQKDKPSLDGYLANHFGVAAARTMGPGKCSDVINALKKWNYTDN